MTNTTTTGATDMDATLSPLVKSDLQPATVGHLDGQVVRTLHHVVAGHDDPLGIDDHPRTHCFVREDLFSRGPSP